MITSIVVFFLTAHSFVLSIEPARIEGLNINDTFRVSVNVDDVIHFYGYNVSITFDSLVLQAIQVTQGPFLRRFGSAVWIPPTILPGKIENAAEALFAPAPAAIGSGTLFTVKFKVIGTGSSGLHFYSPEVVFSTPDGTPLPCFVILDGWYGAQTMGDYGELQISAAGDEQQLPATCWIANISEYTVVWQDMRNSNYDIYGQRVKPDGSLTGSAYAVIDSSGNQMEPALGYNPIGSLKFALVVWTDYRRGVDSADIYGRFLYNGTPISGAEFAIAHYPGFQMNPGIIPCGSRYLVIWQDIRDDGGRKDTSHVYGQLLTNMGSAIGSSILISPSLLASYLWNYNFAPAITAGDSAFLITWMHYSKIGGMSERYLKYRIVDTLGNKGTIGNITPLTSDDVFYQPSCAFDGTNYLVIWSVWNYGCPCKTIKGQFVSQRGMLVGSNFIIYETPDSIAQAPKIHYDGLYYWVVWDEKNGSTDYIKARRVATNGSLVGSPYILCSAPYQQTFPSGTRGTSSIVVWQDYRNGADYDIWGYLGPPIGIEESQKFKIQNSKLVVYPNPFSNSLNIKCQTSNSYSQTNSKSPIIKIFDASGRLVRNFSRSTPDALRPTQIVWDGADDMGEQLPEGVYFIRLQTHNFCENKKIIKIR